VWIRSERCVPSTQHMLSLESFIFHKQDLNVMLMITAVRTRGFETSILIGESDGSLKSERVPKVLSKASVSEGFFIQISEGVDR